MKKLLLYVIMAALISTTITAAGLAVKKPDYTSKWFAGSKYNIKWSVQSRMPMKANIQLLNKSKAVVMDIARNVDFKGIGSYAWFIPMTIGTGEFLIRVSNKAYSGTSSLFRIKKLQTATLQQKTKNLKGPLSNTKNLKLPDFRIYKVVCTTSQNLLVFNIENLGFRYQGPLKLHFRIGTKEGKVITRNVSMRKGQREMFPTKKTLGIDDLSANMKSSPVAATIDWDGSKGEVTELNEKNNSVYEAVYPDLGIPDFYITGLEFVKTGNSSSNPKLPRGHFRVKVKNQWSSCNNCNISLEIHFKFESEPVLGHPRSLPTTSNIQTALQKDEEEWFTTKDFDWPERTPGVKENIWFKVCIWNYNELIRDNNCKTKLFDPDGPF